MTVSAQPAPVFLFCYVFSSPFTVFLVYHRENICNNTWFVYFSHVGESIPFLPVSGDESNPCMTRRTLLAAAAAAAVAVAAVAVAVNLLAHFRTAAPFWGQTSQIL